MMQPSSPNISIIIVSWRVRELVAECIESVAASVAISRGAMRQLGVEIILIDNASNDGTIEHVRSRFPDVTVISNAVNRGFGAANNQGAKNAKGKYLLFLNPDTRVVGQALWSMMQFLEEQPYAGLIGPRIENADGSLQPSCRTYPTFLAAALVLLKLHHVLPNIRPLRRYFMHAFAHRTLRRVDQVMGACMFMRRSRFEELMGFDERFFIWFEEVDLQKRIRESGDIVMFYPDAVIQHQKSSSFQQRRPLWRQWHFSKSCRQYFWKHESVSSAMSISIFAYFSLILAVVVEIISYLGLPPRRRADR